MIKIGDWLSEGWALIKDDIVTFAVAALLVGLIGSLKLGICLPALSVGLFMMVFKKMRGETIAIGDVFQGFSKFGPAFVAVIVLAVAVGLIGVVLNFIPILGQIAASLLGVVVGGAMFYLLPLIATTDISGIDAIKASLEKTKPQIVMYSVTAFVYSLVSGLGAIACFVGQFVTWPLTIAAMAGLPRQLRPAGHSAWCARSGTGGSPICCSHAAAGTTCSATAIARASNP